MSSWFQSIKNKLSSNRAETEAQSDNELRRLKELEMEDTLRKLNQDEILTDDEIARCCESGIVSKPTLSFNVVKKPVEEEQVSTTEIAKPKPETEEPPKPQPQASEPPPTQKQRKNYLDDYDTPEFWD